MRTEAEIVEKRNELQLRYQDISEIQNRTERRDKFGRELRAYALWAIKDQITALDWILGDIDEL